jgi:undecaprenyl-diphosphatase
MSGRALEGEPRLDRDIALWFHEHATAGWTDFFSVVTRLGSSVVLAAVLAVAVIVLARRRLYAELWFLLLAAVGTKVLTEVLKWGFKRDRPAFPDPLATESSSSFPSGHASVSMAVYGSLAIIVVRRLDSTWQRVAVLGGTAVLVGAIGLTRLYLGVHYLTDVLAGYVLALAWTACCALAVLRSRRKRGQCAG